jgi:lipoprotein-anchoring transpeptidase ErfK/SrfK
VLPKIESSLNQQLDADGRLHLQFSAPVGNVNAKGSVPFLAERDSDGKGVSLTAKPGSFEQGHRYSTTLHWATPEGIPLPDFEIDIGTAPPLNAEIDIRGMKNLGIAMPIEITFSEPVQDREKAAASVRVITSTGESLPGKWLWYGKQRLQYRPDPYWPAFQTLEVQLQPGPARSIQGGFLARPITATFSTGSDRRIEVWLDRQRVEVFENGELIKTLKASTGKSKTPTVTGSFYIYARFPKKTMKSTGLKPGEKGYYEVKDVPYAQYFHEGYAFHGAFWHNAFGQPASHGCINLATQEKNARQGINEDAGWLYHWASLGVPVTVHETSPPKNPTPALPLSP